MVEVKEVSGTSTGDKPLRRRPTGPLAAALTQLSPREEARHRRILVWREREATRRELPLHSLLTNSQVIALAQSPTISLAGLRRHGLSEQAVARFGTALLEMLSD